MLIRIPLIVGGALAALSVARDAPNFAVVVALALTRKR